MKVFLDANILFSASAEGSATRVLLTSLCSRGAAVTNAHAWEEAGRNLHLKRPALVDGLESLRRHVDVSNAYGRIGDVTLPSEDIPILAGAVGNRCTHLWTGDKRHFGPCFGRTIAGVKVVSSIELAEELIGAGW